MRRALALAVLLAACRPEHREGPPRDARVNRARSEARVPAIGWAAVTPRAIVGLGGEGEADIVRQVPATGDTVFDAASIAKLVVATSVMQLVDEGKAQLDADVSPYVGFPVRHRGEPITLRMLLTHTSGIRDHDLVEGPSIPLGDYLRDYLVVRGASAFHDAAPGARHAYSNVGAALAAYAVERVRGAPFAAITRARVFAPLGMRTAAWSARACDPALLATPYAGDRPLPCPAHAVWPASDLHASPRDLARFAQALLRGGELDGARILSREATATLLSGTGFQVRDFGVGHEGEDQGATSALFLDPASGAGAVVLANGDAFASEDPARAAAVQRLVVDLLARARTSGR